ncbi:hypothetical protein PV08_11093 [Exophiala spinifera]|uniref:Uncharacterized protein n=1 Tax=Exophiala spinifera TaxID=91928 RepID=A0A0D2ATS5_9EURO|nr:uncharacterized protein PV08_11093 [Exophiala spinifera]KIW10133.1 hypothetical protein PV08_11093 [Exophiala spinifera]
MLSDGSDARSVRNPRARTYQAFEFELHWEDREIMMTHVSQHHPDLCKYVPPKPYQMPDLRVMGEEEWRDEIRLRYHMRRFNIDITALEMKLPKGDVWDCIDDFEEVQALCQSADATVLSTFRFILATCLVGEDVEIFETNLSWLRPAWGFKLDGTECPFLPDDFDNSQNAKRNRVLQWREESLRCVQVSSRDKELQATGFLESAAGEDHDLIRRPKGQEATFTQEMDIPQTKSTRPEKT